MPRDPEPHDRRAVKAVCLAIAMALLGGCSSARKKREVAGVEDRVRHIRVEGNEHLTDKEVREHLNQRETTWFPLPERHYFHEGLVPVDEDRAEKLYRARGYRDAKVLRTEVDEHPRRDVVDVTLVVEEGPPTVVDSIDFAWPEGPGGGPPDDKATPERIETHCGLRVGDPFDVEQMHDSETTMATALADRGYPFAEVRAEATVDRLARTADVHFEIVPGPYATIGRIDIVGLRTVPEDPVRVEVRHAKGKPFSPRRLERLEEAVYGLGVFQTVTVTPSEEPRDGHVDLTITVTESKPQMVELGVGLGLEPNRWEQHGEVVYRHANLFRTLTSFEVRAVAGYAELPWIYQPRQHGPIARLSPRLRRKGLIEDHLVWTLEPQIELGIQEGYQFYTPSNRVGVSRFFTRYFELGLSHNVRFVDFFNVDAAIDQSRSLLGLDFRDPYVLSFVELHPRVHLTDRLLDPRNGVEIGAVYDIAGGIFGGQFDYQKIAPQVKGIWTPLDERLQFAARARLGLLFPFGDEPGVPFDRQFYLGGASTVRGWGLRRLSPRVTYCPPSGDCRRIPIGGKTMVLGNVEARVRVWRDLWTVAFFDAGDVQPGLVDVRPDQWNYAVGPGLRYHSRIGTFRLDLGVRVNDTDRSFDQPRLAVHFGLGEAF